MKPISRTKCVVCEHEHLEPLYNLEKFPVFMGCTTEPSATDVRMDMSWAICPECGTIQLDKLVPLDILYPENHNEAVGGIWQEHHSQFADFILEHATSTSTSPKGRPLKQHQQQPTSIPAEYARAIQDAFGDEVDIYRDVLFPV